ncbi:MAG: PorT family protein [Bacteroidales bacterium]|nr:PorT family protein [Bacteroidales bacterium]
MKIKALFLTAFIFIGIAGQSQAMWILIFGDKLSNDRMQSGINVFITSSNFSGMANSKPMTSWALGGFSDIKIKNKWHVSVEFTVKSPTGASNMGEYYEHYNPIDTLVSEKTKMDLTNLSLPIYIKYKTKFFNLAIGPEVVYTYKANLIYTAETIHNDNIAVTKDAMSLINRFDYGISSSVEFYLFPNHPNTSIRLGLRYYYGFTSPLKDYGNARNSLLMFKVGIPIAGKDAVTNKK